MSADTGATHHLRAAAPEEAERLEELQDRSASHWGYPDGYFDWAAQERRIPESYVHDNAVFVLADGDGHMLGFYSLADADDGLLLDKMFLEPDHIGHGLGRLLWEHAVDTARRLGAAELTIAADPNAASFYEAMGARWCESRPTAEPTWTLQIYRFAVPR